MSTATPPSAAQPARREILIVSHCSLFYWWPVWAVGFLMCLITYFSGHHMATVPAGTTGVANARIMINDKEEQRDALILPAKKYLPKDRDHKDQPEQPRLLISSS